MDLTVALCTRNRAAVLPAALRGLALQQAPLRWELLVVDNASTDETPQLVRAAARDFPVPLRDMREERIGLSFARNRALGEARGDILLFLDDDAVAHPGLLAAHARAYAEPEVVCTGGRIAPVLPESADEWFRMLALSGVGGPSSRYDFGDEPLPVGPGTPRPPPFGANLGLRRSAARATGRFRTDLGWGHAGTPGEETDFACRMAARGGRLVYLPDAIVDHHLDAARCTREYFVRWHVGLGRSWVRVDRPRSRRAQLRKIARTARRLAALERPGNLERRRPADDTARSARLLARHALLRGRLVELLFGGLREPGAV